MDFTQTYSGTVVGGQTGFAVPLIVAVTGHRDLVAREIPGIRDRVDEFLTGLRDEYPDRGVSVMSSLAEGADQLVAEQAVKLSIPLIVPLPMARELYVKDFESVQVREKFDFLSSRAAETYELPVTPGYSLESISDYGDARDPKGLFVGRLMALGHQSCSVLVQSGPGEDASVPNCEIAGDILNEMPELPE